MPTFFHGEFMSNIYKKFRTDTNSEKSGIWLNYGANSKGNDMMILIARAGGGNTNFSKCLEKRTKPIRRQLQNETVDEKDARQVMLDVYADSIILGWENMEDEHNNDLPFNRTNVLQVMQDLPDLFADIQEQAQKAALFRADILENDSKN